MQNVRQVAYGLLWLSVLTAGCAGLHRPNHYAWWNDNPASQSPSQQKEIAPLATVSAHAQPGGTREAMRRVIDEIHELGPLEPDVQAALIEGLQQTDPSLWPMVLQQFRAIAAIRKRAEASSGTGLALHSRSSQSSELAPAPPSPPSPVSQAAQQSKPMAPAPLDQMAGNNVCSAPIQPLDAAGHRLQDTSPHPAAPPPAVGGSVGHAQPEHAAAGQTAMPASGGQVCLASYDLPSRLGWKDHIDKAVEILGNEAKGLAEDKQIAELARLRLLQLAGNRRDEALRPIEPAAPELQSFWTKELYGLATLLDTETIGDADRRTAEARRHLEEAIVCLAEASPLVVRNLAFVTDIQSYGSYTPFEKNQFVPGQRVLLYAEIENFKSNPSPKGYYTASRSSYQIFNSSGQRVAEHEFAPSEEYCRNVRRDFFIGYEFSMPERIFPGKHVLQLTVVDLNSGKIGQTMIEFAIISPER